FDLVFSDPIGFPLLAINSVDNSIVWRSESKAFGELIQDQVFNFDPGNRFPGQWITSESSLDTPLFYNGMRDYDPAKGRYIEPDPVTFTDVIVAPGVVTD